MIKYNKYYILFFFIIIILNLLLVSKSFSGERENKLSYLFEKLKMNNIASSYETEQEIWKIWSTHPTSKDLTKILEEGSNLVNKNELLKAINIFSEIIKLDPNWAEAWNKRATVFYMIGEYQKSQDDIDKVLELEERHFGALAGQGLVNIQLENYEKAVTSYKKALEIYPSMQSPKIMIKEIEELIKKQSI